MEPNEVGFQRASQPGARQSIALAEADLPCCAGTLGCSGKIGDTLRNRQSCCGPLHSVLLKSGHVVSLAQKYEADGRALHEPRRAEYGYDGDIQRNGTQAYADHPTKCSGPDSCL
jgi:hypothetical protein